MQISLKVKTLDSQNHDFTVDDEITVTEFKAVVFEKTTIAAECQRLIYCGRVLMDDKKLKDYDLNGKVVHLVQRLPGRPNNLNNTGQINPDRRRRNGTENGLFRALDGMVLGTMAIPVYGNNPINVVPTTHTTTRTLNPSSTLCGNRITVARHMLDCANNIASYLENPEQGLNNIEMDLLSQQTMESTVLEVGISAIADVPQQHVQSIVEAFQASLSAALRNQNSANIPRMQFVAPPNPIVVPAAPPLPPRPLHIPTTYDRPAPESEPGTLPPLPPRAATTSTTATANSGDSPLTWGRLPTVAAEVEVNIDGAVNDVPLGTEVTDEQQTDPSGTPAGTAASTTEANTAPIGTEPVAGAGSAEANPTATGSAAPSAATGSRQQQTTTPQTLAAVVNQMRTVNTRLEPFIVQYHDILLNDPEFEEADTAQREISQRIFDRVSEALHYMSHAQHAISDLMLDLQMSRPRHLRCRPIMVEQSAFNNMTIGQMLNAANNNDMPNNNNSPIGMTIVTEDLPMHFGAHLSGGTPQRPATATATQTQPAAATDGQPQATPNPNPNPTAAQIHAQQQGQFVRELFNRFHRPNRPTRNATFVRSRRRPAQHTANVARLIQAVQQQTGIHVNPLHMDTQTFHFSSDGDQIRFQATAPTATTTNADSTTTAPSAPATSTATSTSAENHTTTTPAAATTTGNATTAGEEVIIHIGVGLPQRVTAATFPTTATQTRSTPRPQGVHTNFIPPQYRNARPGPTHILSSFDRFLPCHSHHIRENTTDERPNGLNGLNGLNGISSRHQRPRSSSLQPRARRASPSVLRGTMQSGPINLSNEVINSFVQLFGAGFQIRDLVNLTANTLQLARPSLSSFIQNTLFQGILISPDSINEAAVTVVRLLGTTLNFLTPYELPDYDARASVENLIRLSLPNILSLIVEDRSMQFGVRCLRELIAFLRCLLRVIETCVGDNRIDNVLTQCISLVLSAYNEGLRPEAMTMMQRYFSLAARRELDTMNRDLIMVQRYLIMRRPAPLGRTAPLATAEIETVIFSTSPSPMETDDTTEAPTADDAIADNTTNNEDAMATSDEELNTAITNPRSMSEPPAQPPVAASTEWETEPLPSVVIGSETWHSNIPSRWVPMITRDIGRQRRLNSQGPFSDAYLSGMSSKRRKLITSTKPATDVQTLLSDGVRNVMRSTAAPSTTASGSSSSVTSQSQPEQVASAITSDPIVQNSYREAVTTVLRDRALQDPDFNPARYPNISKYFDNK